MKVIPQRTKVINRSIKELFSLVIKNISFRTLNLINLFFEQIKTGGLINIDKYTDFLVSIF